MMIPLAGWSTLAEGSKAVARRFEQLVGKHSIQNNLHSVERKNNNSAKPFVQQVFAPAEK